MRGSESFEFKITNGKNMYHRLTNKKNLIKIISISGSIFFLLMLHSSLYAASSSKQKKMQEKIEQQQDTIDLLNLKLERNQAGNNSMEKNLGLNTNPSRNDSMSGNIQPASNITYP